MTYGKPLVFFLLFLLIGFALNSCKDQASSSGSQIKTITAAKQPTSTDLFYNATIQPIKIDNIVSPTDGTVTKINFNYGGVVKSGTTIITITASKLQEDFMSAVTSFLTAKDKLTASQNSYEGNK